MITASYQDSDNGILLYMHMNPHGFATLDDADLRSSLSRLIGGSRAVAIGGLCGEIVDTRKLSGSEAQDARLVAVRSCLLALGYAEATVDMYYPRVEV